jgi:hypothetical protein
LTAAGQAPGGVAIAAGAGAFITVIVMSVCLRRAAEETQLRERDAFSATLAWSRWRGGAANTHVES